MALEAKPAWALKLKESLSQPYTADELARLQAWAKRLKRLNDGKSWPPGTFLRLMDLARTEDGVSGE
jgi:hypothetical protein